MNKIWILTEEANRYDQYGEYYRAWFKNKPSKNDIKSVVDVKMSDEDAEHIINGGGRRNGEDFWYNLICEKSSN